MAYKHSSSTRNHTTHAPGVSSYDSSHEHSMEHWTEVQRLVDEADEEVEVIRQTADHGILAAV
jgi:hypothetical protein